MVSIEQRMRRLICCRRRTKDFSFDFEEHDRVTTYNGLESFMLNNGSYDNDSGGCSSMSGPDLGTMTDSPEDDASSCSSSKDALGSSFSSQCLISSKQEEEHLLEEWDNFKGLHDICIKGKTQVTCSVDVPVDIEAMKEKFSKLLLGEDISGGTRGISSALALSNAINTLSASVFGELWKLEPLSEERKCKWRREMDWLLSPTKFMVELVPAKQNGDNGRMLEIMTPRARSIVHTTLPALRKLDSMLIEVLDSMVKTEFWYAECGSSEGRRRISNTRQSKKWWLPYPRVPDTGLSPTQRKRLIFQGKFVHQILKAAKSINEEVLLQMPIPSAVNEALPKSAKASLGEDMYQALAADYIPLEDVMLSLNLKSEHSILDTVNRLEGAVVAWQENISDESNKKSAIRYSWYLVRESGGSQIEKLVNHLERAEALLRLLKTRFPNLPHTFIDVTKVKYNKDIGHSIIEAYSRVLVSLAFSIISRIGDIIQEDDLKKPSTPIATLKFDLSSDVYLAGITETPPCDHIKRALIDQMNMVDGRFTNSERKIAGDGIICSKSKSISVITANPLNSTAWKHGTQAS